MALQKKLIERFYHTDEEVFVIYQVNGSHVTNQMDRDFLTFGYRDRFRFIPANEIWIADTTYNPSTYPTLRVEIFAERELIRRDYIYEDARRILSDVDTEEPRLVDGSEADTLHVHRRVDTTRVTTTPYTALSTDVILFVNTDSQAIIVNLPAGINGKTYTVTNTGVSGNNVTVVPNSTELLLGVNSNFILLDGDKLTITYETIEGWW